MASDGQLLAPAKTMAEMSRIVANDYVDTALCVLFVAVVVSMLIFGVRSALAGWRSGRLTAVEVLPPQYLYRLDRMLRQRFEMLCKCVGQVTQLMVGIPDYDTYVAHITGIHPERVPMTYEEFFLRAAGLPLRRQWHTGHALLLNRCDDAGKCNAENSETLTTCRGTRDHGN